VQLADPLDPLGLGRLLKEEGSGLHVLDFILVAGMGFFWMAFFWSNLAGRALVPANDPYFKEAMAHGGH
jgi:hypothetical protein